MYHSTRLPFIGTKVVCSEMWTAGIIVRVLSEAPCTLCDMDHLLTFVRVREFCILSGNALSQISDSERLACGILQFACIATAAEAVAAAPAPPSAEAMISAPSSDG